MIFTDTPEGQTHFDPEAEKSARKPSKEELTVEGFMDEWMMQSRSMPHSEQESWLRSQLIAFEEAIEEKYYRPHQTISLPKYAKARQEGALEAIETVENRMPKLDTWRIDGSYSKMAQHYYLIGLKDVATVLDDMKRKITNGK